MFGFKINEKKLKHSKGWYMALFKIVYAMFLDKDFMAEYGAYIMYCKNHNEPHVKLDKIQSIYDEVINL